jgi:hypothetical protein
MCIYINMISRFLNKIYNNFRYIYTHPFKKHKCNFSECVDCKHFNYRKLCCYKFDTTVYDARINEIKCGSFAKHFIPK